jgi:hypothetical protein
MSIGKLLDFIGLMQAYANFYSSILNATDTLGHEKYFSGHVLKLEQQLLLDLSITIIQRWVKIRQIGCL